MIVAFLVFLSFRVVFFFFTNFDSVYFRFDLSLFTYRLLNFVIDINPHKYSPSDSYGNAYWRVLFKLSFAACSLFSFALDHR